MGRFTGKSCRLITMMALTTAFFLVEISTGYATKSVALVADSFHMLSDIISLIVGFTAIKMSKRTTSKNTYGWQRAEVLGALVNAVFLMALCFTIIVESVQRFIQIEEINDPKLVLIVGGLGLLINGVGLCLFSTHGLGHGHSHGGGGHGHSHGKKKTKVIQPKISQESSSTTTDFNYSKVSQGELDIAYQQANGFSYSQIETASNQNQNSNLMQKHDNAKTADPAIDESSVQLAVDTNDMQHTDEIDSSAGQLNMRGVFLHVLGDALGSVVVIISALIIWLTDGAWRFYVDPAMSLIIVVIIISTTIPLFKQSSMILLQSIPTDVDIEDFEERLMRKVHGIENIHEFHVWQLSGNKIIATAHIRFRSIQDYMQAAQEIKAFMHDEGIHSTTIQPEFAEDTTDDSSIATNCMLMCEPQGCRTMTCCNDNQPKRRKSHPGSEGEDLKKSSSAHQSSSIWSRAMRKARVRSSSESYVDSSKVPLLQDAIISSKQETAMGSTVVTPTTPQYSAEDSV